MVVVLTDYYSRWNEIEFMTVTKTADLTRWLDKVFLTHGYPLSIKSDNGPQFISREFGEYCDRLGIVHHLTTPRWPQANGLVERQNRSIMKRIQIACSNGQDYEKAVTEWLFIHRNTPHSLNNREVSF